MYQILVAEEDADLRASFCDRLRNHFGSRCAIYPAPNGRIALELSERLCPQLAILSVELPDISGLEVARLLRLGGKPCLLLFLSAHENFAQAREAISLRALDYLPKSGGEGELIRAVEGAMGLLMRQPQELQTQFLTGQLTAPEEDPADLRLDHVRGVIERYVRENYRTELSMQDVARAMNYSDAYFCKLFKKCFQITFSAYLNDYRIVRARELLQSTCMNIREVALACGYTDSNYFARVFKRITGMTPTEYRAR